MEQLLESIIKETSGSTKHQTVNSRAVEGLKFLESYSRAPASHYRRKVLAVLSAALESGSTKLGQQSLPIIHKLGRDNRY